MSLAVVVPVYQEAGGIGATLRALAAQHDLDFDAWFVDNGSTDGSAAVIEDFARAAGLSRWHVIAEPQKGTGAAADTGMRAAIAAGATMLGRTDADALPAPEWTARLRRALSRRPSGLGIDLVCGEMRPRADEGLSIGRRAALQVAAYVAEVFGLLRPSNYGAGLHGPYLVLPGCNMGVTAALYEACGGFTRTSIEEQHEDRALFMAARRIPGSVIRRRFDVVAGISSRRVRAWGLWNTLMWYRDHSYRGETVDIR
ncbi:glycosyltransferase involved in cell wall biosynthesis [Microbacterium resistens]|uniref:4,4'-diaponeurosporenoate glycosyltransferase n=1 Tax=Microbacterium resistens TaxID=156977 RepID=A0ABU1SCG1_9MICO|nr:glycosyltransferase [Microbacterium resistens]MDR6866587.1 glycosyltransferase involved in cell wall biosynthesis [Microbacterium resistens]